MSKISIIIFFNQAKVCVFFSDHTNRRLCRFGDSVPTRKHCRDTAQCFLALGTSFPVGLHAFGQATIDFESRKSPKSQTGQYLIA